MISIPTKKKRLVKKYVKKKVSQGSSKNDLFHSLIKHYPELTSERLANFIRFSVSNELKKKYKWLNTILFAMLLCLYGLKKWYAIDMYSNISLGSSFLLIILIPSFYLLMALGVYFYSAICYRFTTLFLLVSMLQDIKEIKLMPMYYAILYLAFSACIIFLSAILYSKLFPQYTQLTTSLYDNINFENSNEDIVFQD